MDWWKRFIWWKCAAWFVLGAALGWAAGHWLPDVGPVGARRISVEEFVTAFDYPPLTEGEKISNLVRYPERDGVELVIFTLSGNRPERAYIYARKPFVSIDHLKAYEKQFAVKQAMKTLYWGPAPALAALRIKEHDAQMAAFKDVATIDDFLLTEQALHPDLKVDVAWWESPPLQHAIALIAGALVIGVNCSLLLGRRSPEQQAAWEVLRSASPAVPLSTGPAKPSEEDIQRVRELDAALEQRLTPAAASSGAPPDAAAHTEPAPAAAPAPIAALAGGPLEAMAEQAKEQKDYAGDFYPTEVRHKASQPPGGFSLPEMLVAIGIIAIILAMLLPALAGARRSADTITCASNLRSIAQGLTLYLQTNQNTFPAAYTYIGQQIVNGVQTPNDPAAGYVHWSSYLYGAGSVPQSAFTCPAMERGGLPPTNTTPDNMNAGQVCPGAANHVVDQQAPRLAYTVNEALCPRNKFVKNFQSAQRTYRYVKANEVVDASNTILVTEMVDNGNMWNNGDSSGWVMSHRPIDGFCNSTTPDVFLLPAGAGFPPCVASDIDPDPATATTSNSRLDLVGRNHGMKRGYPDTRLSNFAYVDGHVETKSVYDTVGPTKVFQWGSQFYSIVPNDDLQTP